MAVELLQAAVERQLEIIGEAMSKLHKTDSDMAEGIADYRKMIAFRNVLIHGYATIEPLIVWGVVESNLESLIEQVTNAYQIKVTLTGAKPPIWRLAGVL